MADNAAAEFTEVDLRPTDCTRTDAPRPHTTSKLNSFLKKTFSRKKRRVSAPAVEEDLVKNSISGPANCSEVLISEDKFEFSRNSIQCCPFDISGYGAFLLMDEFKVQKPKTIVMMVFLFEKIIIFTKKQPDEDAYYYMGSLKMDHVGLMPMNKNKKILELKDHISSTRFHKESIVSLEAASEYIQNQWRKAVEKCLWSQLLKAKREGGLRPT